VQNNIAAVRMGNDMVAAYVVACFKVRDFFCEPIAANASLGLKIISLPCESTDIAPAPGRRAMQQKRQIQFATEFAARLPPIWRGLCKNLAAARAFRSQDYRLGDLRLRDFGDS
jgi:hypothetical protein